MQITYSSNIDATRIVNLITEKGRSEQYHNDGANISGLH